MTTFTELKNMLEDKYGVADIEESTPVESIIGGNNNLGTSIKDTFNVQPSIDEEANFSTVKDIVDWLERQA